MSDPIGAGDPATDPAASDPAASDPAASDHDRQDARGGFDEPPTPPAPAVRKRGRRVTTQPVPGSDPAPAPVDRRVDSHDNDARLKDDKPPHWG